MLTLATITPQQGEWYYQQENSYSQGAALTNSQWWGKGAATWGLSGQIADNETYKNLIQGYSPDGTVQLRQKPKTKKSAEKQPKERAGVDLTFSVPKSVSLACLVGGDKRLEEAHRTAVKQTLTLIEARYAQTRVKGTRVKTDNLTVAMWHHDISRELDPHLHTHCVVMNVTQLPDGKWRSRTDENLYYNKMLLGRFYRNELALECHKLGYEIEPHPKELFEIKGYTREQITGFSKRHEQILNKLAAMGAEATTENKMWAWRKTRAKKNAEIDRTEMLPYWMEEADRYGIVHPIPSQSPSLPSPEGVIFVGETRQRSAPEAGNPFQSLQQAGMTVVDLSESRRRQKPPDLRKAVNLAAAGEIAASLNHLLAVGRMVEIPKAQERAAQIADDYISLSLEERENTLILAGTDAERLAITEQIRSRLKAEGSLGSGVEATKLKAKDVSQIQGNYTHFYEVGDLVMPTRTYRRQGLKRFQIYVVEAVERDSLRLRDLDGDRLTLNPMRFRKMVYTPEKLEVAVGDKLRSTKNDQGLSRRNERQLTVIGLEGHTAIVRSQNGKTDSLDLRESLPLDYALVASPYSTQGKKAERVLIAAAADPTVSLESFCAAICRAKSDLKLYVQDTADFLARAAQSQVDSKQPDGKADPQQPLNSLPPQILWHQYSEGVTAPVDALRVKAIASQALRDGCSPQVVTQMLLEDPYFQEIQHRLGNQKTQQLVQGAVQVAQNPKNRHQQQHERNLDREL